MRSVSIRQLDMKQATIPLGFEGENEFTEVRIDCKKTFDQHPDAVPSMTVTDPAGNKYPAVVTRDGDVVVWQLTAGDLTTKGYGEIQIEFLIDGTVIGKTDIARTRIERSIFPEGEAPEPVQNWLDEANQTLAEVEEAKKAFPAGGTTGQVLTKKSDEDYDTEWKTPQGGGGGTSNYNDLDNKPSINGVTLSGNKSLSDLSIPSQEDVDAKYTKPKGGIPASDIDPSAIPSPTSIIDDNAGEGDTNKVLSADKVIEITDGLSEAIAPKPDVKNTTAQDVDLDIADEDGNVILRLTDGHIKTQKFDSSVVVEDEPLNPYHDVLFNDDTVVQTTTHDHCLAQSTVDVLLSKGLGALALSNYYPSAPFYPLSEKGITVPTGTVEMPNAEHHDFTDSYMHMNSIGSTFASGKAIGETPIGINDTWQHGIIKMKRELLYADGGGMTINHIHRTGLTSAQVMEILDFDDDVIGIEFFNQEAEADLGKGWALDTWDDVLVTGRKCWGFAVPDHYAQRSDASNWEGKINLFVPEATQEACLKAIRNGAFYAQIKHTSLALTNLVVKGHTVAITVNESATIKTVIDGEVADTTTGTTKTVNVPDGATYVRFEVSTANDAIFTNPIMYKMRGRK